MAAANGAEVRRSVTNARRPRLAWVTWKWLVPAVAALAIVTIVVVHNIYRSPISNTQSVAMNAPASPQTNALSATIAENDKAAPTTLPSAAPDKKSRAATEAFIKKEMEAKRDRARQQQLASSLTVERNSDLASQRLAASVSPNAATGAPAGHAATDAVSSSKSMAKATAPQATPRAAKRQSMETSSAAPTVSGGSLPAAPQVTAKAQTPALSNLLQKEPSGGNDVSYIAQSEPNAAPTTWRITDDGHLQRATASGQWTPVLTDQAVFFHAVALVGGDVWAGGSDGALFHSTDNGEHWTRVALAADGQSAHGAVRSIRFATTTAGQVTTDAGETWSTSDGGKTWSRN